MSTPRHRQIMLPILLIFVLSLEAYACQCLSNGECYNQTTPYRCRCPQPFIGDKCQFEGKPLTPAPIQQLLTHNLTYFYFQPDQTNYYQLIFTICMKSNPKHTYTYFNYETERDDGSFNTSPSIFQSTRLRLRNNACTNLTTYYVSIKRREDDSFKKILVSLKIMSEEEAAKQPYFSSFINQNSFTVQKSGVSEPQVRVGGQSGFAGDVDEQVISISVNYEVYIKKQYSNTIIIILTSASLLLILLSFAIYLNKKYRNHQLESPLDSLNYDLNTFNANPQSIRANFKLDHHQHINIFMPVAHYGSIRQTGAFDHPTLSTQQLQNRQQGQQQCCSICLQQFQQLDETRRTPCRHSYHRECIDNWFQSQLSCPVCRRKIDFSRQIRKLHYQLLCRQLLK